jgi:hypothetical protein
VRVTSGKAGRKIKRYSFGLGGQIKAAAEVAGGGVQRKPGSTKWSERKTLHRLNHVTFRRVF